MYFIIIQIMLQIIKPKRGSVARQVLISRRPYSRPIDI